MAINLSGWPYIFFLVFIASITWLPTEAILKTESIKNFLCENPWQSLIALTISIFFSGILLLIVHIPIFQPILPVIYDNFYKKCIEWENEIIILTLKNGKAYIAILWKYPEVPTSRHESRRLFENRTFL